jgi:ubiquinone/menaquinone biosynthesis C-methylase UbiE
MDLIASLLRSAPRPSPPQLLAAALGLALLAALSCSATALVARLLAFGACRRAIWRFWYGKIASDHAHDDDIVYMNYGYAPTATVLPSAEAADQLCANLYLRVAAGAGARGVAGKRVLEVGAGRGGGASLVARTLRPARVVAVDFSPSAVALAQRRHAGVANLEFRVGDAEKLPFADAEFDVVLNVESSHCYGNVAQFVAEVARVLKPGGVFAMADFRSPEQMSALEALLRAQAGLELVEAEDITSNVLDALDVRSAASPARLSALSPSPRPHARFLCSWTTSASASRSLRRLRQSSAGSLASSRGSRAAGSTPGSRS